MRIEIDDTQLIDTIVKKVVEHITPLLKHNSKPDNELMTVETLAGYLNVKKSWIYGKIHTRQIPFRKIGKFPRFEKKHIDLWGANPYHPDLKIYNLNHNARGGD